MKRWICSLILLLTGIVSGAAEEEITYPRKLSCQISVEETFEVVPRPGWTVYPQRELALRFWSLLIRGPEDRFSLQLNFFCDTKDLARFDTPEKMRRAPGARWRRSCPALWKHCGRVRPPCAPSRRGADSASPCGLPTRNTRTGRRRRRSGSF
ncbi:MAG: hypothetical protein L6W00_26495 [Lentisphaeria bacterium]|nr:MAG: hypothetical protein L6W00_26495 [Lentisphaeria bacterium]